MGHDIFGINKAGEEIAYARFNMWNSNAHMLYRLLDANKYDAGVSGSGKSSIFSIQQIEKALNSYHQLFKNRNFDAYDQKQIQDFILNCLATAKKDGNVRVYFG